MLRFRGSQIGLCRCLTKIVLSRLARQRLMKLWNRPAVAPKCGRDQSTGLHPCIRPTFRLLPFREIGCPAAARRDTAVDPAPCRGPYLGPTFGSVASSPSGGLAKD